MHGSKPEGKERQSNICYLPLVSLAFLCDKFEDGDNVQYKQSENGVHEEEEIKETRQSLSEEESDVPVDELPQYFQHLKLIHDSTPTEGNENSLRLAVRCNNLERLERLWEDYCSGRLNELTEKYLVTDEIKRRFHVESINLATTILEEDYLACKEFLSSKPSKLKITFIQEATTLDKLCLKMPKTCNHNRNTYRISAKAPFPLSMLENGKMQTCVR